jgi:hypothetical protein
MLANGLELSCPLAQAFLHSLSDRFACTTASGLPAEKRVRFNDLLGGIY